MNTEKKKLITAEGLKGLSEELEYLKVVRRKEIADKIKDARDQGDLTENAEYDAAKDEQREIEARIEEIESLIKNAEVVAQGRGKPRKVNVGCSVTVLDEEYGEEEKFSIVGSTEASSLNGRISNESPVGSALLGHKVGDIVEIQTETGSFSYKILAVDRMARA